MSLTEQFEYLKSLTTEERKIYSKGFSFGWDYIQRLQSLNLEELYEYEKKMREIFKDTWTEQEEKHFQEIEKKVQEKNKPSFLTSFINKFSKNKGKV